MKNKNTIDTLKKVQAAITQLDARGEDENISNALAVVFAAIQNTERGAFFTPDGLLIQAAQMRNEEVI